MSYTPGWLLAMKLVKVWQIGDGFLLNSQLVTPGIFHTPNKTELLRVNKSSVNF